MIEIITTKGKLYDKCENMEELYDDFYYPLLVEHKELKKQLEEWITHLIEAKKMLDIQAQQGNYDFDEYMLGIYNGMEYIVSIFENREPEYISDTEVKFINNKQKEFILYLEDEKDKKIQELSDKINKAIDFYETYKQECVIGRTKDERLIKDYYLPAKLSKKLIEILKEVGE